MATAMIKFINGYYAFLKIVLTVLMGVLIIPVTMQIIARYIEFVPRYIWTEEMARFCFIWIIIRTCLLISRGSSSIALFNIMLLSLII